MMTGKMLKKVALEKTMPLVDKPLEDWKTFNDELNTYIMMDNTQMRAGIQLIDNEEPILECILSESLFLVTTERVISKLSSNYDEMNLKDFAGFGNDYESENSRLINGKLPKTNLIAVKRIDGGKFYFRIDSYYPAHFAKVLIQNLASYQQRGRWFFNPSYPQGTD